MLKAVTSYGCLNFNFRIIRIDFFFWTKTRTKILKRPICRLCTVSNHRIFITISGENGRYVCNNHSGQSIGIISVRRKWVSILRVIVVVSLFQFFFYLEYIELKQWTNIYNVRDYLWMCGNIVSFYLCFPGDHWFRIRTSI